MFCLVCTVYCTRNEQNHLLHSDCWMGFFSLSLVCCWKLLKLSLPFFCTFPLHTAATCPLAFIRPERQRYMWPYWKTHTSDLNSTWKNQFLEFQHYRHINSFPIDCSHLLTSLQDILPLLGYLWLLPLKTPPIFSSLTHFCRYFQYLTFYFSALLF